MAGEIFISYRRADEAWARLLYSQLKAEGVEAWYDAHVGAGQDWRAATAAALSKARIFVLLFSKAASESDDIAKELAAATFSKKLVVPVRIENIQPEGAFLYELASRNWINAFENTEAKLAELAQSLANLVKAGGVDESVIPFDRNAGAKTAVRKQDWLKRIRLVIAVAAAMVIAAAVATVLFWPHPKPVAVIANSQPASRPAGISVAVLPFLNLSSDKDQEFFSDGITEEITSALAKVPGLTVIGRTSAFQFKGENKDMRTIGQVLGARNLIEGSVRKAGNQVRITVQLIKSADGTHLWTESYNRKLTDIFAVQEDIATAIASAMQVPLGLKPGQSLVSNRTTNTDLYQDYLRALALFRARKMSDVVALLKAAVARDSHYAPAWALLAHTYTNPFFFRPIEDAISAGSLEDARKLVLSVNKRAEDAAREAIRLDPQNANAYDALASNEERRGNWAAGEDYNRKALSLDPNNPDILYSRGYLLAVTGRLSEAMRIQNQILAQEPFIPVYHQRAADLLWAMGQNDAAIKIWEAMAPGDPGKAGLAKGYATVGRYAQAADALLAVTPSARDSSQSLENAAQLLRTAPAKVAAPADLPPLPGDLTFVYLFIGAEGRSLELNEREISVNFYGGIFRDPWAPPSAALRKTQRFKDFVRKARFVEYWRARGWPEFCYPVGINDFACH